MEPFIRTNSVRDRMRKFTESSQNPSVPALRKGPLRNGTASAPSGHTNLARATELFERTAASPSTSGDTPTRPRADSTSHTSAVSSGSASETQSQATPQPRGVANKALSSSGQSHNSMGGTRHPAEKGVHVSSNSKEDITPGRAAGQEVTEGEADPDMKTFLTIEIKDGRTTTSSTSSTRGNIVPITSMAQRLTSSPLGQRAGKSISLTSAARSGESCSPHCAFLWDQFLIRTETTRQRSLRLIWTLHAHCNATTVALYGGGTVDRLSWSVNCNSAIYLLANLII